VDTAHTNVGFTVRHLVINQVRGKFNEFSGTILYDEKDITKSSLKGTIQVGSMDTDPPKRDKHLQGNYVCKHSGRKRRRWLSAGGEFNHARHVERNSRAV
jgi:polyisoprenoid-binding protein YceI